ncbi:MAG TPA: type 4a pilus biogenesis protein PilO [Patescibacteria group bacterium]
MNLKFSLPKLKDLGLGKPKQSKLFLAIIPGFKEKRAAQFTTLALTLATISFFGIFAINPTLGTISDLQKQLDDSNFTNQSLQKKISDLTTLQQKYSDIQDTLNPLYDAIPTAPTIDVFVGQLHTMAGLSNVELTRVQTLPVDISLQTLSAKYTSYEFSVEAQGQYSDLEKYVANIASFNRLITLESVSMTHVGKVDSTFRMQIRGRTYFKT